MPATGSEGELGCSGSFRLIVDGESWEVAAIDGQFEFRWLRANLPDYGFSSRPSRQGAIPTVAQVEEMIRDFMSNVDPATGYLD